MSSDAPVVVKWREESTYVEGRGPGATFEPFQEGNLAQFDEALNDGSRTLGMAKIILPERATSDDDTRSSTPVVSVVCRSDHQVHVYVGVHDEATGTSHMTHHILVTGATGPVLC